MRTVRRLLYRDIVGSVAIVAAAFLSLFYFIDFVEELPAVGTYGYTLVHAALASALALPAHAYELMPISVLIGTIISLSRLAQSSEFTILRTGGLGPGRALALLAGLALAFAAATFAMGDWLAPWGERAGVALKARVGGGRALGDAGAWLKERRITPDGERLVSINVMRTSPEGVLETVRLFEFDTEARLRTQVVARTARIVDGTTWALADATVTRWPAHDSGAPVRQERHAQLAWPTTLGADVVAAAVLPLSTMTALELWQYVRHLDAQEQANQRYAIQFWKKALYPLDCLVMVALALPFAYLGTRGRGASFKVFGGILLGISFVLLNNVSGHLGVLRDWSPWIAASAPGMAFLLLSLAAFAWLVRYR